MKFRLNEIGTCLLRQCSSNANYNLVGRHLLRPSDLTHEEILSVIWTAIEMKQLYADKDGADISSVTNRVKNSRLTLLMKETQMDVEIPTSNAASYLKSNLKVITDLNWDQHVFVSDVGEYLSVHSDIILCQAKYHSKLMSMSANLSIPVVNLKSCRYTMCTVLTHLMTLQLRYGRLHGLNMAWIGPPSTLFNTYLCMAPRVGINICYSCTHCKDKMMSPAMLQEAKNLCGHMQPHIIEGSDCKSAITNAHVVVTSTHNEADMKVSLKLLAIAKPDWSVLCSFPRQGQEIDSDVLHHKNSLVRAAASNSQWIVMALVLRLLCDYKHQTEYPKFQ